LVVSICPYFFFVFGFMRLGLAGAFEIGNGSGLLAFGLIFLGCLVAVGLVYPIPGSPRIWWNRTPLFLEGIFF
jgi:hypothetical protein